MNAKRIVMVAIAAAALMLPGTQAAFAEGPDAAALERIAELNPGLDPHTVKVELKQTAARTKTDYDDLLAEVLAEAERSAASADGGSGFTTMKEGDGTVSLGSAQRKGDLFVSPSSTLFVQHGHIGVYYSTTTIVEAPGNCCLSRSISAGTRMVGEGTVKQYVSTSQSNRDAAANYARGNFLGRSYDNAFWNNRSNGDGSLNCSELVWLAYLRTTSIDLDRNGGWGVYPYDIRDSGHTVTYASL
ncbi:hypothetical protein [Glycomyces xiaoerkulensis]|uniref:hypothetical protein n=1 Tax=Glycomyces xiaoerkulensis TaxID=2038139 RepID=UPI000C255F07|nr:hypothetical protein [Glycomyces xiaoerkulensis]